MSNPRCAIIGSKGYIGRHIEFYLLGCGYSCASYDVQDCESENYQKIDITDPESVAKIDLSVDYIFMFAGLTGTYAGFDNYRTYNSINELGLLNLLDAVRRSNFRPKIIYPSTRLVYKGIDKPLKEGDEKETKTIYAANKLACEGYLQAYYDSFDMPYTVFRICIPYGNLLTNDYSFGTIGFFIKQAKSGKNISLYGGGTIKRTFTHIEDLCHQVIKCALLSESNAGIYNIGGETLSLRDAAEIIANKFEVEVIDVPWPEKDLRIESNHTYFDDSKIQSMLHFGSYKKLIDFTKDL